MCNTCLSPFLAFVSVTLCNTYTLSVEVFRCCYMNTCTLTVEVLRVELVERKHS